MEWLYTALASALIWIAIQLLGGPPDEAKETPEVKIEAYVYEDCGEDEPPEPCERLQHEGRHQTLSPDAVLPPANGVSDP